MQSKPGRSRRLRKKLHVGEFQQFGFEVDFRFREGLTVEARNDLIDAFICEAIDPLGLQFGGAEGGFVGPSRQVSVSAEHREQILAWLGSRSEVQDVRGGQLVDAWRDV